MNSILVAALRALPVAFIAALQALLAAAAAALPVAAVVAFAFVTLLADYAARQPVHGRRRDLFSVHREQFNVGLLAPCIAVAQRHIRELAQVNGTTHDHVHEEILRASCRNTVRVRDHSHAHVGAIEVHTCAHMMGLPIGIEAPVVLRRMHVRQQLAIAKEDLAHGAVRVELLAHNGETVRVARKAGARGPLRRLTVLRKETRQTCARFTAAEITR